jgi:hypothetical protein
MCGGSGTVTRRYGTAGAGPARREYERPCPECGGAPELQASAGGVAPAVAMDYERSHDMGGLGWEDYVLYALEVERDEVNEDALEQIAEALRRAGDPP